MIIESIAAMDWFEAELGKVEGLEVKGFHDAPTKAEELSDGQAVAIVDTGSDSQSYDKGKIHPVLNRDLAVSVFAKIEQGKRPSDVLDSLLFKIRDQLNPFLPIPNKPMGEGEYRVIEEAAQKQPTERTDTLAKMVMRYTLQYKRIIKEP